VLALAAGACTGHIDIDEPAGGGDADGAVLPPGLDADPAAPDADPAAPDADTTQPPPVDAAPPGTPDAAPGTCGNITGTRAQQVCLRWTCDRADLDEGTWTGAVSGCNAGDTTNGGRENALELINAYRFIADLPPVTHDATKNARAQACALMMDANDALSHAPPTDWTCYTAEGAMGAGTSNIAGAAGVFAVDMYMNDNGNSTTIGHRRWLLSNSLGPVGLGSTDHASCALVLGGSGHAGKPWMAWPPVGPVPFEAFQVGGFGQTLDKTGWSVQSDSIKLDTAEVAVTVTEGGTNKPVVVNVLGNGYGSSTAIRFVPSGWTTQAGHTYHVKVSGISTVIEYDVEVIACD
jgi:uncharacterized protein YkwD